MNYQKKTVRDIDVKGKRVVCVMSGGNIDVSFVQSIIEQGLVARHRRIKFAVKLLDRPGSLEQLLHILASMSANILTVQHDKLSQGLNPTVTTVSVVISVEAKPSRKDFLKISLKLITLSLSCISSAQCVFGICRLL